MKLRKWRKREVACAGRAPLDPSMNGVVCAFVRVGLLLGVAIDGLKISSTYISPFLEFAKKSKQFNKAILLATSQWWRLCSVQIEFHHPFIKAANCGSESSHQTVLFVQGNPFNVSRLHFFKSPKCLISMIAYPFVVLLFPPDSEYDQRHQALSIELCAERWSFLTCTNSLQPFIYFIYLLQNEKNQQLSTFGWITAVSHKYYVIIS